MLKKRDPVRKSLSSLSGRQDASEDNFSIKELEIWEEY